MSYLICVTSKHERTFLVALYFASLLIRIAYFIEYKGLLEFLHPTVDALYHHLAASAIASGAISSTEPFFRAPFYNYFLGIIYFLTGDSIAFARLTQLLIGSFTPLLTYLVARRIFNQTPAIITSILILLSADIVYFEAELLLEFLLVTFILLIWYSLLRNDESPSFKWLALAGLLSGIATITRPNAAVIVPVILLFLWSRHPASVDRGRVRKGVAIYLIAAIVPVGIVLAHNLTRPQPAFTIATQGGINFYIGNNDNADGVSAVMPGKLGSNWQFTTDDARIKLKSLYPST